MSYCRRPADGAGLRYKDYGALGTEVDDGISWFWIGTHDEYDKIVS